eukprot:465936-Lingulodinium_polyedra.AAC.1
MVQEEVSYDVVVLPGRAIIDGPPRFAEALVDAGGVDLRPAVDPYHGSGAGATFPQRAVGGR